MYREMFGFADRAFHQSELRKPLFDLYQEGLTPPQVNHVQRGRLSDRGRVQPCRSTFLRLLTRQDGVSSCQMQGECLFTD